MTTTLLQAPPSSEIHPDPPESATVLTVDDEPSVLNALRRVFRAQGIATLQATSAAEGLVLLKTHRVDLVISDMRMPEMDGARFLELVRNHDESIVRILLTGYADMSSTIAAINKGAIHRYIAKPWDDQDLVLVVREALTRRDLEKKNAELTSLTKRQNEQLRDINQTLESRVVARTAELQQINGMLDAAYEDLDKTFVLAVNVFSSLMEMRGGHPGHARRVADLSRETAKRLKLSERDVRDVYLAALVHDIGTIGFPDTMLKKPVSTYTADEHQRYRRHTIEGETALMALTQLQGVAKIVRQHHERVDGKGFPDGLAGTAITMGARIVAAASDLDELAHGALGELNLSVERVNSMLMGGVGTHYDKAVIEILLKVAEDLAAAAQNDVQIDAHDLRPGMVLARAVLSAKGATLLAAGYMFDERVVKQVTAFAEREGVRLTLWVKGDSLPPDVKRIESSRSES
ncbi:HD domain-containing phosphohydrolase [Hydrogenophaga sp. A37]|uniref:HD domain-containing phosphohydrolase n=1 Tax=Hydrogenophaga sp. A37 TaxID=1945864 RepID=UPI00098653CD|nr:HD domain-containing phosphohydrolase [Hydrogenophaga sp. A37]